MQLERYRIVRIGARNDMLYCKDKQTGARTSLKTRDHGDAERLVQHKNEAAKNPDANRKIGMAYLSTSDPTLAKRIWQDAMDDIIQDKSGSTRHRYDTAMKDTAFNRIRKRVRATRWCKRRAIRR
jgi:hypothetical protein